VSEGKGENVAVPHGVDLKELFRALEKMGLKKILVEGGGELNWSLLRLGMVDELNVTVAPKIAGGRLATTLVEGDGFDQINQGIRLELRRVERKKTGELVLHYRPR
jgi:2,5-diamino-6-(ribosylamino)-4(3H)-pyrimidinone 5'-phosphate reductase